jgi:hypothetical protein
MTMSLIHPTQIDAFAHALARDGLAPHEARLRAVAEIAGKRGADPLFVAVALDRGEPEVARLRAFARVARVFARRQAHRVCPAA